MMELVEAPMGAMALLAGLRRQRDGGPFSVLVPAENVRRVTGALELFPWTFEVRCLFLI